MHKDVGYTGRPRLLGKRDKVLVMTMHAAVGNQPEKMEPMATGARENFLRDGISGELAFHDRLINSSKILINDSTGPQVKVTNLRVAHLAFGEADVEAARA